jgi:hypothetical protein
MKMNSRVKVLKQLVADERYVIDEAAIADAIILRSALLRTLPDVSFRCASHAAPQVRSFRPHRGVRSFRLTRAERRPQHGHGDVVTPPA